MKSRGYGNIAHNPLKHDLTIILFLNDLHEHAQAYWVEALLLVRAQHLIQHPPHVGVGGQNA